MRFLLSCALCASFVSPAAAVIEITEDTVIDYDILDPAEFINVRGDATLTLGAPGGERPILLGNVNLWDQSSLVFGDVDLRDAINVAGENRIDFVSGRFVNHFIQGYGNATVNVDGDTRFQPYVRFSGGSQVFNVRMFDAWQAAPVFYPSPDLLVNAFAFLPTARGGGPHNAYIGGIAQAGTNAGNMGWVEVFAGNRWFVYANDDRPAGDTNSDGVVDLVDLNNVRNHFGSLNQDFKTLPLDGTAIDLDDLNNVRNTFGQSTPVSQPVPEPASLVLLGVALLGAQGWHVHERARARARNAG